MSKPVPYGITPSYKVPVSIQKRLLFEEYLTRIPVHQWNDLEKLIEEQISYTKGLTTGKQAFKSLNTSLSTIKEEVKFLSLKSFACILKKYYQEHRNDYLEQHSLALRLYKEKKKAEMEAEITGTALIARSCIHYKRKLEEEESRRGESSRRRIEVIDH